MHVLIHSSKWNQSPANDGVANCAGVNVQGKIADLSCGTKQGYICKIVTGEALVLCPHRLCRLLGALAMPLNGTVRELSK